MIRPLLIAALLALTAAGAPAAALAQETNAPPGLSAADEYLETVPAAGGNSTVNGGRRPSIDDAATGIAAAQAIPKATSRALRRRGAAGRDAAAYAGQSAPRTGSSRVPLDVTSTPGPLATFGRILTGSSNDGLGALFPLLLVAGFLAVAGAALLRRRDDAPA